MTSGDRGATGGEQCEAETAADSWATRPCHYDADVACATSADRLHDSTPHLRYCHGGRSVLRHRSVPTLCTSFRCDIATHSPRGGKAPELSEKHTNRKNLSIG